MAKWLRFEHQNCVGFGMLREDEIAVHTGNMFDSPTPTGQTLALAEVTVLTPSVPTKMVALVANFRALIASVNQVEPPEPLYFLKGNNSFLAHGETIRSPASYTGGIVYEAELGIVIGRRCKAVTENDADTYVFGHTCVNDVTAIDFLNAFWKPEANKAGFTQWTRAKSFDTFGAFGPVIATGIDVMGSTIRTILNDVEQQNYPVADMLFSPAKLVSLISHDMTLEPGDVIACGTSIGVGPMVPGSSVSVVIDKIGNLTNRFE